MEEILGSASHVTLYGFDLIAQAWVRAIEIQQQMFAGPPLTMR